MFCRPSLGTVVLIINFVFYHIYGIFSIHCLLGIILYYIILYCIVLYCIVLYCIVLYYITLHYIILYYIIYFLLHYFAAHPTTATLFSMVTRVYRRFAQDSTVRAGLDGSRRTRRFSQTELDGSRRTRRFAQT